MLDLAVDYIKELQEQVKVRNLSNYKMNFFLVIRKNISSISSLISG
jgi:hypothetical protein